MGNIIAFAHGSYTHHLPEMFMKAATVAILLSPGLDRAEPTPRRLRAARCMRL